MRWHVGRVCDTLCWLKCPWHHPIPPLERLQLGPISKVAALRRFCDTTLLTWFVWRLPWQWRRYRRFPWKLVMHLITVVALTIHVVRYSDIVRLRALACICARNCSQPNLSTHSMAHHPSRSVLTLPPYSTPRITCSTLVCPRAQPRCSQLCSRGVCSRFRG